MKILDLTEFIWNCKPTTSYLVSYRDKLYRKYSSHWEYVNKDDLKDMYMVDVNFSIHLDKVWDKNFKGKTIKKISKIVIQ